MFAIVPIPGLNKQVFVLAGPLAGIKLPTEGASGDEVHKTNNTLGVTHSKKTMGTPMKDSQDGGRVVRFDMEHQDVESPSTPQRDTTSNVPSSIKVGRSTPKPLPASSRLCTSPAAPLPPPPLAPRRPTHPTPRISTHAAMPPCPPPGPRSSSFFEP